MILSEFQLKSIEATKNGSNSLVIAGTGSGKTLCAEFAIEYFTNQQKKVIYITPIKALSNQKYYEFTKKFQNISIGLLTGDIKCNPDADCIIMTNEILRNKLFNCNNKEYDFSLENVKCLVIDEVHYINDEERGNVIEEIIINISKNIQLIMLSATIQEPENFAKWITKVTDKETIICGTSKRIVPLIHMSMLFFKDIPKHLKELIELYTGPVILKNETETLKNYEYIKKILNNDLNKKFVINSCITYLFNNEMLPAIFFSLSRKNVELYAKSIETNLQTDGYKISSVQQECRKIISKFSNYKEYMELPEYTTIIKLLEKGIAYHHSGMLSIFRELVELMFEKGYVKLLFATETFAVGINMPTKTVIFDNLNKFDGNKTRLLYPHEYSQMSGRAGRRGIDTIGYVIHLNNLFNLPTFKEYEYILSGTNVKLTSKFKINYELVLRSYISNNSNCSIDEMCLKSGIAEEYIKNSKLQEIYNQKLLEEYNEITFYNKIEDVENYYILINSKHNNKNKKKINEYEKLENIKTDLEKYQKKLELKYNIREDTNTIENSIYEIKKYLVKNNFLTESFELTNKGIIAANIHEVNSLVLSEILDELNNYCVNDIIAILSTLIQETQESTTDFQESQDYIFKVIENTYNKLDIDTNINTNNYELVREWTYASNEYECKLVLQKVEYIGTFVKLILKLNNLITEICGIEIVDIELKHKLADAPRLLLKHIVTNQSIYI